MKKANDTMRPPIVAPWNPPRRGGKRGFDGGRGRSRKGISKNFEISLETFFEKIIENYP